MKKKLAKGELAFYIIAGVITGLGVALAAFGIVGDLLDVTTAHNWILTAENAVIKWSKIAFDWQIWGTIFIAVGVIVAVIDLLYYAKKDDVENEKALRRAQRLGK
ncbi:MAG: hypothetical protein NTV44_02045 [Firmicutes bacterium]|nr:hypothetical protein [Bacillota bacterium]